MRKAIKKANQVLETLKMRKYPDKTFIGRVERGFDFLGYLFSPPPVTGLEVAKKTIDNHVANISPYRRRAAAFMSKGRILSDHLHA